jgi:hypothetical protein
MSSIAGNRNSIEPVAIRAWAQDLHIYVELHDDRVISFPAHKFHRLAQASQEQLEKVRIRAEGSALRWDELDEDISVAAIVQGIFEAD